MYPHAFFLPKPIFDHTGILTMHDQELGTHILFFKLPSVQRAYRRQQASTQSRYKCTIQTCSRLNECKYGNLVILNMSYAFYCMLLKINPIKEYKKIHQKVNKVILNVFNNLTTSTHNYVSSVHHCFSGAQNEFSGYQLECTI